MKRMNLKVAQNNTDFSGFELEVQGQMLVELISDESSLFSLQRAVSCCFLCLHMHLWCHFLFLKEQWPYWMKTSPF